MKKSKVIVPALAMIGLSAVASVTGSVAWFTAQRNASLSTSDFVVTKTDGNLGLTLYDGIGTTATNSGSTHSIAANANTSCTDASLNPVTKILYTDVGEDSFDDLGDANTFKTLTETDHPYVYVAGKIYYAYTWKMTFNLTDGVANTKMNIFFNINESSMTGTDQADTPAGQDNLETKKGFRIAMISETFSKTIIYAGLQDQSGLKALNDSLAGTAYGTSPFNTGFSYFAADKYGLASGSATTYGTAPNKYAHAVDGVDVAAQESRPDYLCSLTSAAATTDVYCIAWYEGTDINVVNKGKLQKVASTLKFYTTTNAVNA